MSGNCADKRYCRSEQFNELVEDQRLAESGFIVTEFPPTLKADWADVDPLAHNTLPVKEIQNNSSHHVFWPNATGIKKSQSKVCPCLYEKRWKCKYIV